MSTITIRRGERPAAKVGEGGYKTGRVYADFVVDGQPLSAVAQRRGDLISCLGWGARSGQDLVVQMLLAERLCKELDGRVPIYVCPEDGDLHCGAITAVIERIGPRAVWRDFGYETGLDTDSPELDQRGLADMGPYEFPWPEYESAIRAGYGLGGFLEEPLTPGLFKRLFRIG